MPIYVYDPEQDRMVDKKTGLPMVGNYEAAQPLQCPRVMGDIEPYLSPVDGQYVSGRKAKRDDLKRTNSVDYDDIRDRKPRRFKNERFAKKYGVEHLLER